MKVCPRFYLTLFGTVCTVVTMNTRINITYITWTTLTKRFHWSLIHELRINVFTFHDMHDISCLATVAIPSRFRFMSQNINERNVSHHFSTVWAKYLWIFNDDTVGLLYLEIRHNEKTQKGPNFTVYEIHALALAPFGCIISKTVGRT